MMRQRFAIIGAVCFAGFYIASYLGSIYSFIGFAVFIAAGVIMCFMRKQTSGLALVAAAASFVIYGIYSLIYIEPVKSLCGETYDISAVVTDVSEPDNDTFAVTVESVIENTPVRLYFYVSDTGISSGDIIDVTVKLSEPKNSAAYNDNYNYSKGIFVKATAISVPVTTGHIDRGLFGAIKDYSLYLKDKASECLDGDEGAMLLAMFFGDRSRLSNELSENIRKSGLSHMTSVSGMHISLMLSVLIEMLGFLGLNKRPRARFFVTLSAAVIFAVFFGFTASVIRSAVMLVIYNGSFLFRRYPAPLNSLGAAVLIILLCEPCACRDTGLLLSASGTIGVGVLSPYLMKKIPLLNKNRITGMLTSSVCAAYCTIPASIICFGGISTVSAVSSLLVFIPFYVTLLFTLIFALTGGIFGSALLFPAGVSIKTVVGLTEVLGSFRYSYISFEENTFIWYVLSAVLFMTVVFLLLRVDRYRLYAFAVTICMLFSLALAEKLAYRGMTKIDIYSDGKDYLVTIKTDGGISAFSSEIKKKLAYAARKALTDNSADRFLFLSLQAADKRQDMFSESFDKLNASERHYASDDDMCYNVNDEYFISIEEGSITLDISELTLVMTRADELFETADIAILSGYKMNLDISRVGEAIVCDKRYTDGGLPNAYYSKITVIINDKGEYILKGADI